MSVVLKFYTKALQLHPWKTQLLTTGFLMGSSDVIAQTLIEKQKVKQIELPRVIRFAILGTCFVAPVLRVWYLVLERKFGAIGKTVGLKKMLCDQFMFSPCFLGCFLTVLGAIQFQPWHVIKAKVKKDYFTVLKTNYMVSTIGLICGFREKLWPGAQLITFYLIPFHMRIVFVSFVALLWNTYLAYQANRSY